MNRIARIAAIMAIVLPSLCQAEVTITMNRVDDNSGAEFGKITLVDTPYGLLIRPDLSNMPAGLHGFHVHMMPSCDEHAAAAGGHFDPAQIKQHNGPYTKKSHLGDLPALYVDNSGKSTLPILAPRLSIKKLHGHSLMIHADGDNYSDTPLPLGGGGARLACGIIP